MNLFALDAVLPACAGVILGLAAGQIVTLCLARIDRVRAKHRNLS